jgi:hypothetical protein
LIQELNPSTKLSFCFDQVEEYEWMGEVFKLVEERAFAIGKVIFNSCHVLITPALTKAKVIEIDCPRDMMVEIGDQDTLELKETEVLMMGNVDASELPKLSCPILNQLTLRSLDNIKTLNLYTPNLKFLVLDAYKIDDFSEFLVEKTYDLERLEVILHYESLSCVLPMNLTSNSQETLVSIE